MSSLATAKMPRDFESFQPNNGIQQPKTQAKITSPLNVEGIALDLGRDEIVQAVRESRAHYTV